MARQRRELVEVQAALWGADPVMDSLIEQHGPAQLRSPTPAGSRFAALAESIAYQQLNGRAAATIWGRVVDALDGDVTPGAVLAAGEERLRPCGLSGAKTASLLDLADHVERGDLPLGRLGRLPDADVIAVLTPVRGIGRWTAQMFLMFNLGRLDVWPIGDYGVRNGYSIAWGLGRLPTEREFAPLADRFTGARSLVAWYCWRAADTTNQASGRS